MILPPLVFPGSTCTHHWLGSLLQSLKSSFKRFSLGLNNTYQFLTIPNNTWQTWNQLVLPGINKASSITANMIPVSWRYCHDTVLMVFCPSGIIMVPILAIFTKPLMLIRHLWPQNGCKIISGGVENISPCF